MKTCSKSLVLLLTLISITLIPVLKGQKVKVLPEVTGYIGHDVTLPCKVIQEPGSESQAIVSQVQWDIELPGEEKTMIVFNPKWGLTVNESLKDRVKISEQELIIKDVNIRDAGQYTCTISTYPSGSFGGSTKLVVREQKRLSSVEVSAIVITVFLLLVVAAAVVYLVFIRKRNPRVRHRVYIDTGGPVRDVARPSVFVRDEDVVYSDIKLKPSRDAKLSSIEKHTADDITYSEVVVFRQEPKPEDMYARVIKV